MNPHLSLGAIFALGLRGVRLVFLALPDAQLSSYNLGFFSQIEKKLALPFAPVGHPSVSPSTLPKLATSLAAATVAFAAKDSKARDVFGDEFVDHFAGTRWHEIGVWESAVTDWELRRYLELA